MNSSCQLKAVLFDLDGVLVDTARFHTQAWSNLVRSLGFEPPHDLDEKVKGISRVASLRIALGEHVGKYTEDELVALATKKNDHYIAAASTISPKDCFPGVRELFADLKKNNIKIVLGSASKNAKQVLDGLEITHCFDAIADGFVYKHGKPHPEVFLVGARMVGVAPAECIVVEDAAAGIMAGLDGGFVTVGMGNAASLKHAHCFIRSLTEISAAKLQEIHACWCDNDWRYSAKDCKSSADHPVSAACCTGNGTVGACGSAVVASGERNLVVDKKKYVCPDYLSIRFDVGGERIDFSTGAVRLFEESLNLQCGLYSRHTHWVSPTGKELVFVERRFADIVDTRRIITQYEIEPLNFSDGMTITYGIEVIAYEQATECMAVFTTGLRVVEQPNVDQPFSADTSVGNRSVAVALKQNELLHIDCVTVVALSTALADSPSTAKKTIAAPFNVEQIRIEHTAFWRAIWERSGLMSGCDLQKKRFDFYQNRIAG